MFFSVFSNYFKLKVVITKLHHHCLQRQKQFRNVFLKAGDEQQCRKKTQKQFPMTHNSGAIVNSAYVLRSDLKTDVVFAHNKLHVPESLRI